MTKDLKARIPKGVVRNVALTAGSRATGLPREVVGLGASNLAKNLGKLKGLAGKIPTMKKGGMVKKTGIHLLHQGEMVLPSVVAQHMKKMMAKK